MVPDVILQFDVGKDALEVDASAFVNPPLSNDDDFFFNLRRGHTAINAAGAWNAGYRGAGATVAVLDAGVYCQHRGIGPNLLVA